MTTPIKEQLTTRQEARIRFLYRVVPILSQYKPWPMRTEFYDCSSRAVDIFLDEVVARAKELTKVQLANVNNEIDQENIPTLLEITAEREQILEAEEKSLEKAKESGVFKCAACGGCFAYADAELENNYLCSCPGPKPVRNLGAIGRFFRDWFLEATMAPIAIILWLVLAQFVDNVILRGLTGVAVVCVFFSPIILWKEWEKRKEIEKEKSKYR